MVLFLSLITRRKRPTVSSVKGGIYPTRGDGSSVIPTRQSTVEARKGVAVYSSCSTDSLPQPRYKPPPSFLSSDVGELVMSLMRNRGRIDTEPVRRRWRKLDEANMPLAVYLRDIEERGAWQDLHLEIQEMCLDQESVSTGTKAFSIRHLKVLALIPQWALRGEELMRGLDSKDDVRVTNLLVETNDPGGVVVPYSP